MRILMGLLIALAAPAAIAQDELMFADGMEDCSMMDVDQDRLRGCHEVALGSDPAKADTDDDGLFDGDEVLGTLGGLNLPAYGVSPTHKDLLIEYDWFDDASETGFASAATNCTGLHSHRPTQAVLERVASAFANAPVNNPDGTTGIRVVQDAGQDVGIPGGSLTGGTLIQDPDGDGNINGGVEEPESTNLYMQHATPSRRGYFHHVLMAHRYKISDGSDSSGNASFASPRAVVTLYCYVSTKSVANTIFHELGHNFGLRHGGAVNCNWKPNYNSVMNYRFQFEGTDTDCDSYGDGELTFSTGVRPPLDENNLDERNGVCGQAKGVGVNWNYNALPLQASLAFDINERPTYNQTKQSLECGGSLTVLNDFDDWSAFDMSIGIGLPAAGAPPGFETVSCAAPGSAP